VKKPYALSGLIDKLYWRAAGGRYCCFKKNQGGGFSSLCERFTRERSHGQAVDRPEVNLRCGICDGREAERRGWDESGPATVRVTTEAMPKYVPVPTLDPSSPEAIAIKSKWHGSGQYQGSVSRHQAKEKNR